MKSPSLSFIIPGMIFFLLLEFLHSWKENKNLYKARESKSNVLIGLGAVSSGLVSRIFILGIFELVYQFRFCSLGNAWWIWHAALMANDFSFYWYHRAQHSVNWFWASHVVHHSSLDYNLLTSFRTTWLTGDLTGRFMFWIWMPLAGFNPLLMMVIYEILQAYQFWLHTETIKKLPAIIEFIFNTPSHHRVHHGSDFKYLDKNHGGIFIFWDRLFGTFQVEEEHPIYGLTANIDSNNPFIILFNEWTCLFRKIFSAGSFKNAMNYIIQPPGWSHNGSTKTTHQLRKESLNKQRL